MTYTVFVGNTQYWTESISAPGGDVRVSVFGDSAPEREAVTIGQRAFFGSSDTVEAMRVLKRSIERHAEVYKALSK